MIDGAYNNENYPNDFFVDLMFTEVEVEKSDVECKDAFWEAMAKTCKEKQTHLLAKKEKLELPINTAPATAFIIDEKKEDIKVKETEDSNKVDTTKDEEEIVEVETKKEQIKSEETKNEAEEEDVDKLIERLENEVQS